MSKLNGPLSCRVISTVIAIILLSILLIFLLPGVIYSSNSQKGMINYKEMDVKSLTAEQMDALIGKKYSEMPVDPNNNEMVSRDQLPKKCRVIPPGSVVTMDWVEDRLNVHLNSEGKITKVKKG